MAEEGSGARVVRNTLANGIGQILAVGVSIVLTPFLIRGLGTEEYGVFVLALTFTFFGGWAALADLGVEGATVRYVAEARARRDLVAVNCTVSTAMVFFGALALIITPLLIGLAAVLVDLFPIKPELQDEARVTFMLVACQLVFELPARAMFAVLEGSQRFGTFQMIEVSRALIQAMLFVAVLVAGLGIEELALAMLIASVVVFILAWTFARRAMPELSLSLRSASRSELRRLVTFGGGLLAVRVMGTLYRQMDKVIIGAILGVRPLTPYDVANKIHAGASMVQTISASSLLPATAYVREKRDVVREMYLRGSSYTTAVTLPVIAAAFIFTRPLIEGWVGKGLADDASEATRLFLAYLAIVLPHIVGVSMLVALGKLRWVLAIALGVLVLNLGISLALVSPLGIEGAVLGTLVSNALSWPLLYRLLVREFEVSGRDWIGSIAVPNLPGLVVQAATAVPFLRLADRLDSLATTALLFILSVVLSIAVYVGVGLRAPQRNALFVTLEQALGIRISIRGRRAANSPPDH